MRRPNPPGGASPFFRDQPVAIRLKVLTGPRDDERHMRLERGKDMR